MGYKKIKKTHKKAPKKGKSDFDRQQEAIEQACEDLKEFLLAKNESYQGSAFREITYDGRVIYPYEALDCRIIDKMRRLQSDNSAFEAEDTEKDLCGYLVLKQALTLYEDGIVPEDEDDEEDEEDEEDEDEYP